MHRLFIIVPFAVSNSAVRVSSILNDIYVARSLFRSSKVVSMSRTILAKEGNEITLIKIVANSSIAQRRKNREDRLVTKTLTVRVLRNQCRREAVRSTALRIFDPHLTIDRNRSPRRIAINVSSDFRNCFKYRRNES